MLASLWNFICNVLINRPSSDLQHTHELKITFLKMFEFILDFSPMHIYIYCFGTAVQNIYDQILVIELDKVLKYGCKKKSIQVSEIGSCKSCFWSSSNHQYLLCLRDRLILDSKTWDIQIQIILIQIKLFEQMGTEDAIYRVFAHVQIGCKMVLDGWSIYFSSVMASFNTQCAIFNMLSDYSYWH